MSLTYGFIGSTEVSKEILNQIDIDPEIVVSFSEEHRHRISGFATYPEYGDKWIQVDSINDEEARTALRNCELDIILVMAWQELLDDDILDIPEKGCVGRHLSLLPKRRGRAPVAWSLLHGLEETGVTLFWLDKGVDTGDIISQQSVQIDHDDEAHDLHDKLTDTTVDLLGNVLGTFESGIFPRTPQNDSKATYTHPRRPDMGLIDWEKSVSRLYDFIRAQTHPYPGAFTYHSMDKITVWHAAIDHRTATRGQPGEILADRGDDAWVVQAGTGILEIEVENDGGNYPIKIGKTLGCLP